MHPIVGSEEMAAGRLTRAALRWNYTAIHPNIYLPKDAPRTPNARILSAYLWTGRKGIIAGRAAAREHGVYWALTTHDVDVIAKHRRPVPGVEIHDERIGQDEISGGEPLLTSPARTALDIGRRLPRAEALTVLDALAAQTGVTVAEVQELAARYPGMRGIPAAREVVNLMDAGSGSREETLLRLSLVDYGLPRPTTDIVLEDKHWSARIAMGWEWARVGVSFDPGGSRDVYSEVQRLNTDELVQRLGWLHIRAHPQRVPQLVRFQVREALLSRGYRRRQWLLTRAAAMR
uniref:AbiEi antitoxin C-terminal domain-containing protein n=1 Tax=Mycobacterium sp. (strain JLS) TaxID=164757 RepID=A0A5Q5CC20_MYCSJ